MKQVGKVLAGRERLGTTQPQQTVRALGRFLSADERRSVVGSVISPVLKVCGNLKTYARMSGDMDVNAGRVILGESTIAERGREIFESVVDVAAGKLTKAEPLGHRECCVPYKYQETRNALS